MSDASGRFTIHETHGILSQPGFEIGASSDKRGWASLYASVQHEVPYEGVFNAVDDQLIVLHLDGPATVHLRIPEGEDSRLIPPVGVTMMPGGMNIRVRLGEPLHTLHLYLRRALMEEVAGTLLAGDPAYIEILPRLGDSLSGCHDAAWIWVGCVVTEDGATRADANGVPETRQCFVKQSQCEIFDTWYTTGMRGTGSNDIAVRNIFVPEEHSFSFQDPGLIKRPGPLYAFPFMFAAKGAAVSLGIARHAINALIENAATKPARRYTVGDRPEPPKTVRDDVYKQDAVGRADTLLTSARAYLFDVMGDFWETLVNGEPPSEVQIARFSTVNAYVTGTCAEVVQSVYKAAGGSAVYEKGPFDRCLRDVLTINQHAIGTPRTYEMAGRLLLGLEPLRWLF